MTEAVVCLKKSKKLPEMPMPVFQQFNPQISEGNNNMKQLEEFIQRRISVTEVTSTKWAIAFPMHKIGPDMQSKGMYEVYLVSENNKFYLSDEGTTYEELDKIFELKEPDVTKNLDAILKQYNCIKKGNYITVDCSPNDIHIKIGFLIQAMSFMLNMKIFYV